MLECWDMEVWKGCVMLEGLDVRRWVFVKVLDFAGLDLGLEVCVRFLLEEDKHPRKKDYVIYIYNINDIVRFSENSFHGSDISHEPSNPLFV